MIVLYNYIQLLLTTVTEHFTSDRKLDEKPMTSAIFLHTDDFLMLSLKNLWFVANNSGYFPTSLISFSSSIAAHYSAI